MSPRRHAAAVLAALAGAPGCLGDDVVEHGSSLGWEGGSDYWRRWSAGPPADPSFFPIAVWLQSPSNAAAYKAIGINVFLGLYEGPTEQQLADLKTAGMATVPQQNAVGLAHLTDPTILAWMADAHPDNAQKLPSGDYGPCLEPSVPQEQYRALAARDPSRPVYLMLGQGVANDRWIGRGRGCTGRVDMYPEYAKAGDILAFHAYPLNTTDDPAIADKPWVIATGVDRLRQFAGFSKPVWPLIETTAQATASRKPTPAIIKAEVWMALVHGALGISYFAHVFEPRFVEAGILADATIKAAVQAINQEIRDLAPVLNSPTVGGAVTVASSNTGVPVDVMVKRQGEVTYLFAVAMRDGPTTASFTFTSGPASGTAEAIGEKRKLPVVSGVLSDSFVGYGVHLYKVTSAPPSP